MNGGADINRVCEMLSHVLLRNAKLPRGAHAKPDGMRFLIGAAFGIDVDRVTVVETPPFDIDVSIQGSVPESQATVALFTERYRELFVPVQCTFAIRIT